MVAIKKESKAEVVELEARIETLRSRCDTVVLESAMKDREIEMWKGEVRPYVTIRLTLSCLR